MNINHDRNEAACESYKSMAQAGWGGGVGDSSHGSLYTGIENIYIWTTLVDFPL